MVVQAAMINKTMIIFYTQTQLTLVILYIGFAQLQYASENQTTVVIEKLLNNNLEKKISVHACKLYNSINYLHNEIISLTAVSSDYDSYSRLKGFNQILSASKNRLENMHDRVQTKEIAQELLAAAIDIESHYKVKPEYRVTKMQRNLFNKLTKECLAHISR